MKILILCIGNSCRSQMAQGFLQAMNPGWSVVSAGTQPALEVHPLAIQVMAEKGVALGQSTPQSVSQLSDSAWDIVLTVCDDLKEACPIFAGEVGQRLHIGFPDPARFTGSTEEILAGFRQVRDDIEQACLRLSSQAKWV